jgi:hypothetical protein
VDKTSDKLVKLGRYLIRQGNMKLASALAAFEVKGDPSALRGQ